MFISSNTGVGSNALATSSTGTGNIGYFAGSNISSGSNNIDIGNSAPGNESDTIRIGNTQTAAYLAGVSGVTVASGVQVYIDSNGQLGTLTSSPSRARACGSSKRSSRTRPRRPRRPDRPGF